MTDNKQNNDENQANDTLNDELIAKEAIFETLSPNHTEDKKQDINLILDIPVHLSVELGRTKMTIKDLLNLTQGSVIALDGLAGEPLDILINGYLIAQGEIVVVGDNYGVRITDIITPSERVRRLSR
ncbi:MULTISPECIES: flagellar motor switch protein FliN [unclassified Gilliamella]|uniref:flagellar motor switch protein FliN n=1 Tax=unclassified Gilliamella TaxID=2685620 RepID=UPI00226A13CE|nr:MULTISPECIES: flagellar motor switch protein FliN [unclassified Gilliamella]MCX8575106.1 flagellar motor switch protein FliN [Gilliamella sp. B3831]MCX8577488.1 flagellar motor switch protein FliN [Gilliamella sp. B3815]MCX8579678.1 flagellar motor switch protein FliN [Gilliamella sp. B2717]MCX8590768.1 flagellar motor switch protein FliN [Gilliamella sp. B3812]MCX8604438.1 flagellar motor switch protein FliN [Gilliamella sp. B3823]